ncbi:glycoside hydrolase family 3 N-terminal domain-containing protein [Marivirga atlantica]|jgi:beta-glucosidase-like glycosyl hydrolase/CubicO group peptidase (beta-lactamase class C family)|uniref:beta-N-acetylhexosaminidase n=1 Tax=Marivirga atlantica TaxID=1548457 RepID=A0A937AD62_9BACT|nr:glycoside hydrolase family 3 N-terminal domain-containing protein [Marivirga atlantica]MBL0764506.1 serine hydrolase [Marivirga atlantica]
MFKKVWLILLFCIVTFNESLSQKIGTISSEKSAWVDSVYSQMSLEERIGQLFMVAAYSNKDQQHVNNLSLLIEDYHIGGLIFFQGGPGRQIDILNKLQEKAKIPLWIGMDAEWGLAMRLDSTMKFPKQMTLGAIQNDGLIYAMGAEIARHAKAVGVDVNFAPVVDVNNNSKNPVIGYRSFGENKENVARKGVAYMRGMQDNGVLANAKHFPGHGDTESDSHHTLPQINHSKERLENIELYPFKKLIENEVSSMMVAHLNIPAYDSTKNLASTLSKPIVTDLLKKQLGFNGLIFTDALNMQGVASYYEPGETDLLALQAGNDVLLFPMNVPKALGKIKKAIQKKELSEERLAESVKKILAAKYDVGYSNGFEALSKSKAKKVLYNEEADILLNKLYEHAATLVKTKNNFVPIRILDTTNFASLSLRGKKNSDFQKYLSKYARFQHYQLAEDEDNPAIYTQLMNQLRSYETVVVGLHDLNNSPGSKFGINQEDILFLQNLAEQTNVVLTVFGNAYSLKYLTNFDHILLMYEDNEYTHKIAPQIIFGAKAAKGKLPVSVSKSFKEGTGIQSKLLNRLGYAQPLEVGMDKYVLAQINEIANEAINTEATPGCQIIVAKDGQIVLEESYGFYSYQKKSPVTDETIYDLASITKVAATLQGIMFLYDRGIVDLDKKIVHYLPELKRTNKKNMTLRNILTHQAGLLPYIPFWKQTNDFFGNYSDFYSSQESKKYPNQLSSALYGHEVLDDSVYQWVIESDLLDKPRWQKNYDYRYSDMGYYLMQKICERMLNLSYQEFLSENIYHPLGMNTMCYLPLCNFPQNRIAPTEDDPYFRSDLIHGWVHDQGAAMIGGVAGHAGLFSNAMDLAILMQMNLWDGAYGGTRYFSKGTVPYFTKKQYDDNRRGLGWDKPVEEEGPSPTSHYSSPLTFGHTGFTGTAAWADPEFGLVFIFLSNRIHPDASNRKLISSNIRTRIMDVIYQSIFEFEEESEKYVN